jgi:hypothetical protein
MSSSKTEQLGSTIRIPDQVRIDLSCVEGVVDRMLSEEILERFSIISLNAAR